MANLNLQDLMKKASEKGLLNPTQKITRPWQQENILTTALPPQERENNIDVINRKHEVQKLGTNREQTGDKLGTQSGTDSGTDSGTNREQIGNKKTNREQTGDKLGTQSGTDSGTNREQIGNKSGTKNSFSALVGLQKAIVVFIYKACKEARAKHTEALSLEHISYALKTSNDSIKTTIKRLERKSIIERIEYKCGRGGWSKYSVKDHLFQEMLQYEVNHKLGTNWEQIGNKSGAQTGTQMGTTSPSSSNILNTTTISTVDKFLPQDWLEVDLEPLAHIGFTENQLRQLYEKKLSSPEIIQTSINNFAFGLENNEKVKNYNEPLNVIMGVLRKGQPWTEANYISPKEKALKLLVEQRRAESERIKKLEQELMLAEFDIWVSERTQEEIDQILPDDVKKIKLSSAKDAALRTYFIENVWSLIKGKIL